MNGALPHVVHVISTIDPRAGGTTTQLVTLVRAQVQLGLSVTVVSTYAQGFDPTAAEEINNAGVRLELVGPGTQIAGWHPKISPVLRDVLATADVVHIHGLWEEIQHRAAVIAREMRCKYLFTLHGTLEPWAVQQSRMKKQIYMAVRMRKNLNTASALHYTDDTERELTRDWGLTATAIIQPYAIDLAAFEQMPSRGLFRRAFRQLADAPYVLFLGRLHPRKGLELLLEAFAGLPQTLKHVKLVIAGPSAQQGYEAELYAEAIKLKISDRVIFAGALEGNLRAAAYADAAVFALPSRSPGFGSTVIEALACGARVVVSSHVAVSRQIQTAGVGRVVGDDVNAWSAALADTLRESMENATPVDGTEDVTRRGRDWVMESFNAKACALSWATMYDQIIQGTLDANARLNITPAAV